MNEFRKSIYVCHSYDQESNVLFYSYIVYITTYNQNLLVIA